MFRAGHLEQRGESVRSMSCPASFCGRRLLVDCLASFDLNRRDQMPSGHRSIFTRHSTSAAAWVWPVIGLSRSGPRSAPCPQLQFRSSIAFCITRSSSSCLVTRGAWKKLGHVDLGVTCRTVASNGSELDLVDLRRSSRSVQYCCTRHAGAHVEVVRAALCGCMCRARSGHGRRVRASIRNQSYRCPRCHGVVVRKRRYPGQPFEPRQTANHARRIGASLRLRVAPPFRADTPLRLLPCT